jgi:predicted dehydrogenase
VEAAVKVLVIGLGSMGKRRIRNLKALGVRELAGVDPREDRRAEAAASYAVPTFGDARQALQEFAPDVAVISTPPDKHMDYAFLAFERRIACFIEASVVDAERVLELHEKTRHGGPLVAPSCTMRYFPGPRRVKELVSAGAIGKVVNINYHTGQYLKDWHPWEAIEDYYVSKRATGGCREIVPFELTWLNDIFGEPEPVACLRARIGDLQADIDDVYHCWLRYPGNATASITVEVLSRPVATRELRVLGTRGLLAYSADDNAVRVASLGADGWTRHDLERGTAQAGYINPEEPYIAEMRDFLAAVESRSPARFPNSLLDDYRVLRILNALEQKSV